MPNSYETVAVSGGMDPVHKGHVRMIQEAAQFGEVIVILNSDQKVFKTNWIFRKLRYSISYSASIALPILQSSLGIKLDLSLLVITAFLNLSHFL